MVVGDFRLDHYLVGNAGRISRQYSVVILTHERDEYRPGSAANTVANLAVLRATVVPVGLSGVDPNGDELLMLLARAGCDPATVVRSHGTRTVTKTRSVASGTQGGGLGQHLLRVDWLGASAPNTAAEEELQHAVKRMADAADGFVLSDYGAGTITPRVA